MINIPDWKVLLSEAIEKRKAIVREHKKTLLRKPSLAAGLILLIAVFIAILWKKNRNERKFVTSSPS